MSLADTLRFLARHPLTRDRPLNALVRFAAWQVRSRMRIEVVHPWVGDARLVVRRGMTGATGNIYCGLHEFADMAFVLHILRPGNLFVDVGANVGSYTVLASKVCGASTIAIEPDPGTAEFLRRNIDANDIADQVEVVEAALGSADGRARFTVGLDTCNRVATVDDARVREVRMLTLDTVLGVRNPMVLKLDVEGFEASVLAGAHVALASSSLLAVLTETASGGVSEALYAAGFRSYAYEPFNRVLEPSPSAQRQGAANALYIRDVAEVRARLLGASRRSILGHMV